MVRTKYRFNLYTHINRCANNYVDIVKLLRIGSTANLRSRSISLPNDLLVLRFDVRRSDRYTSDLTIRQENQADAAPLWMKVRIFHDVRKAEVFVYQWHRNFKAFYEYPNAEMLLPNEKDQVNKLLSELLMHCLQDGISGEQTLLDVGVPTSG